MSNDLRIKIIGSLNIGSTIGEINTAIKGIEKKIQKLKLDIQVDEKITKTLSDFSKAMENHKKINQDLNRVIKEADGTIKEKIRQHLKSGEIIDREIKKINQKVKVTQQETKAIEEQTKAIQKQGQLNKQKFAQDQNGNKKLKSETYRDGFKDITYNTETGKASIINNLDQERKATENLISSKRKLKDELKQLSDEGKISSSNLAKLNNAINNSKNIQQVEHLEKNINNLNRVRDNEHKLELARQQALINAQKIKTTHGGYVDNQALNQYLQSVNQLTPRTANLNQQLQLSSAKFNQLAQDARSAAGATQQAGMSIKEMFSTAMVRYCRLLQKCN